MYSIKLVFAVDNHGNNYTSRLGATVWYGTKLKGTTNATESQLNNTDYHSKLAYEDSVVFNYSKHTDMLAALGKIGATYHPV